MPLESVNPEERAAVFFAPVNLRYTTDVSLHWGLFNAQANTKNIYIRRICVAIFYEGGARSNTSGQMNLNLTTVASGQVMTPVASVAPIKRATGGPATIVGVNDCGIGDATNPISYGAGASHLGRYIHKYQCDAADVAEVPTLNFVPGDNAPEWVLRPLDALTFQFGVNSGSICGFVQWDER